MNLMDLVKIGTDMYGRHDKALWDDIVLDSRLNKDVLLSQLVLNCAQAEPLFNTFSSFKWSSDAFFLKWQESIKKLTDTLYFDYNPIWNKDGTTKYIKNYDRENFQETTDDYNENNNLVSNSDDENTVSAYNSSGYQPHDKNTISSTDNRSINSGRDLDKKESEGYAENYTEIQQGNIGVTTTQQMIKEEREIQDFNVYDWIVKKYRNELFLRVY